MSALILHPNLTATVVRELLEEIGQILVHIPGVCVAGGFVRDRIIGAPVKDIDLFATSKVVIERAIEEFEWTTLIYGPKQVTANAVGFCSFNGSGLPKVQFVTRVFYPTHEELIHSFDFSICQAALYHDGEKFVIIHTPEFGEDITSEKMRYTAPSRDEDPGGSVIRMLRFAQRGFKIDEASVASCLGRFYSYLSNEPEEEATKKVKTAFRNVGYAGRHAKA